MKTILFLIMSILVLSACDFIGVCDTGYQPGIEIVFKNEAGEFIASEVTAVVFDGNYQDTLTESHSDQGHVISLAGAHERSGVYSLVVVSDLYETYTKSGIIVMNGKCHVKAAKFEVTLTHK